MTQIEGSTGFRDRKGGLIFFGIVEILMGLACLLMMGVMLLTASAATGAAAMPLKSLIGVLFMYGLMAAFFITMGIGSILARRWARAIMLMVSALWLVVGVVGLIMMFAVLPLIFSDPAMNGAQIQPGTATAVKAILMIFLFVFFILVPGGMFFFYRSPNVKATCEARDPQRRWTDRPLLVLSLSLISGFTALSTAMTLFTNVVPFFGIILTGIPAMIYAVILGAVAVWGAWHLYQQRMQGWLAIAGLSVVGMLSWGFTLLRGNLLEMYQAYGTPQVQLEQMKLFTGLLTSPAYVVAMLVSVLVWVGYLWFVRKALLAVRSAA